MESMVEWDDTILLRGRSGTLTELRGPADALEFMENDWPANKGHLFERARHQCTKALKDPSALASSRLAVNAAFVAADLF